MAVVSMRTYERNLKYQCINIYKMERNAIKTCCVLSKLKAKCEYLGKRSYNLQLLYESQLNTNEKKLRLGEIFKTLVWQEAAII